jgi:hypothetical protein
MKSGIIKYRKCSPAWYNTSKIQKTFIGGTMDLKLKDTIAPVTGMGSQIGFGRGIAYL